MDKRVIFAVAGSGKTSFIINSLDLEKKSLIVTYTINNYYSIKERIIQKFGYLPDNIKLYTFFNFIYSFCYKPFLSFQLKAKGINFDSPENLYIKDSEREYYFDSYNRLYSCRIAKLLSKCGAIEEINKRLSKYYDNLFIDEVQDFAGHDFNFLLVLATANLKILFVGDFFQHTYDSSRDGSVNANLHEDYGKYIIAFPKAGVIPDIKSLNKSWRCSPSVCSFIENELGVNIQSHRNDSTLIQELRTPEEIMNIYENRNVVKLFYQSHNKYDCFSNNWGASKGEDCYSDVCVVMNERTYKLFKKNKLKELSSRTKNKLYVALSRTRNNLYLVSEKQLNSVIKINSAIQPINYGLFSSPP